MQSQTFKKVQFLRAVFSEHYQLRSADHQNMTYTMMRPFQNSYFQYTKFASGK